MKKTAITVLLIAALLLSSVLAGCKKKPEEQPQETEFSRDLLGDWFGILSVTDSGGKYRDNNGITNDCVMRSAATDGNTGVCYLVVNGIGDGILKDCAATFEEDSILLNGTIGGVQIENWVFRRHGDKLELSSVFGNSTDYMKIEIVLRHCGAAWNGDKVPEGYDYTLRNGFGSLVTVMGGDPAKLPQLNGKDLNLRLSTDEIVTVDGGTAKFDDPDRVISANGQFSVRLPEGFSVVQNDSEGFAIANESAGVRLVTYESYTSNEEAFDRLYREAGHGGSKLYHYTIDGYNCFAAIMKDESYGYEIILFGDDGDGHMLEIHYHMDCTPSEAEHMLEHEPANYYSVVLGLLASAGK